MEVSKQASLYLETKPNDPAITHSTYVVNVGGESVAALSGCLLPSSLQQNEIVRIRLLDRRDRFSGDSFSETGAKGKLCHASTPYASRAGSVPVTGPFARGCAGGHGRVKICNPTC